MHRRTVLELMATGGAVPLVRPGSLTAPTASETSISAGASSRRDRGLTPGTRILGRFVPDGPGNPRKPNGGVLS